jgi:hypothetical protein
MKRYNSNLNQLTVIYLFISNEYLINHPFAADISVFYKISFLICLPFSRWGASTTGRYLQNKQIFAIEKGI